MEIIAGMLPLRTLQKRRHPRRAMIMMTLCGCLLAWCLLPSAATAQTNRSSNVDLAVVLAREGQWVNCRREALRVLVIDTNNVTAALLVAISGIQLGHQRALKDLAQLVARKGFDRENSLLAEKFYPGVNGPRPQLHDQCVNPVAGMPLAVIPAQWFILLYRSQVSPALGERCNLIPSCSGYAQQALHKHGLLGIPIIADRLCREQDVVMKREGPVVIGNRTVYPDPLAAHDNWMQSTCRCGGAL
jgi:putative component of membrane protein insertase Oxa1/YidC/SpoIIIJ protein YidD